MALSRAEKIRKFGEVFTPGKTVREMCDMLEAADPAIFEPMRTFLEPACGDGAFVAEILRRKFERCRGREEYPIALESVYGFELQADNVEKCIENVTALCGEYFKLTPWERGIISNHIIQCDGLKVMRMLARMGESESGNLSP
jgi:hypothetical protein